MVGPRSSISMMALAVSPLFAGDAEALTIDTGGIIIAADGNGDGRVDALDYTVWRNAMSSGAGGIAAVLEPTVTMLVTAAAMAFAMRRRTV